MKKIGTAVAFVALTLSAPAMADDELFLDPDETPLGRFVSLSGTYDTGQPDDPSTVGTDESEGNQYGYISVDSQSGEEPEVQVCNGNEAHSANAGGADLTGYIYVSPSGKGKPNGNVPGSNEYVGATDGQEDQPDGSEYGKPCPRGAEPE